MSRPKKPEHEQTRPYSIRLTKEQKELLKEEFTTVQSAINYLIKKISKSLISK